MSKEPQKQDAKDNSSNFHVIIRVRPTSSPSFDTQGHVDSIKYIRPGPENSILLVQPHSTQGDKVFIYDDVFGYKSNTKQIFDKVVLPNISDSLFKGFSHTILVYGMTGAGKTFTMFGENFDESTSSLAVNNQLGSANDLKDNRTSSLQQDTEVDGPVKKNPSDDNNECKGGLVSETVKYVLANQSQCSRVKLKMSYLEIYNESIRDLLSTETMTSENLMILEDPDKGVYCPLLSEKEITNLDQISTQIKQGNKRRVMASTKMNQFSSRSHAIIQLSIEIEIANTGSKTVFLTPKLYLVDLAGSERAAATEAKGVRFKEGANINKSLLSLGNCITVLSTADKKKHVPYRDSKLTRLLKESLGGNAKTLFVACVTPAFKFVEETINTLNYAQRAKSIQKDVYENVKQIYHQIDKTETVRVMHNEIENLKDLLQQSQNDLLGIKPLGITLDDDEKKQGGIQVEESEEEKAKRNAPPPKTPRELFQEKFQKLSDLFEEILFRNRELECNLAEFNQSREQNEKLVHEIMDTINPASLTQKEMKYRLDKVNTLRSIIKNNEDVIIKLQKELQDNEVMKNQIKKELEELYELKFIQECQQLKNFQLVSAFEQEKKKLREQISQLMINQQKEREEEVKREQQIQHLRDEINFIKKKANASEQQLMSNQEQLSRSRGRGKQLTLRSSSIIPQNKITPRNVSQKDVSSKYLNIQTFVPSSSISVHSVRGKSANIRASLLGSNRKSELNNNESNTSQYQPNSMSDINLSPTSREFEEYKRKEQIIGSQLKNMQKNSSQKNVSGSKTYLDVGSSTALGQSNTSSSQIFSSPNRQSNHVYKSSYKSSFIDLAPQNSDNSQVNYNSSDNSNGKNQYQMQNNSQQPQSELLNPNQNFLFISQSQLTNPQMQSQYDQQQRANYNSSGNLTSNNMYQSPQGSNQKSTNSNNTPQTSSQKTSQQTNSQKNLNNPNNSVNGTQQPNKVNSISNIYPNKPANESPQKYQNNIQQDQINKPGFNNYQQNNVNYGQPNQQPQTTKIPTTAITLNLGK